MAKQNINPNSILFLYEGETEGEFYKKLFEIYLPERAIRLNTANLQGVYGLNDKVKSKIKTYLLNDKFKDCNHINVFVAIDREAERNEPSQLQLADLEKEFIGKRSRVKKIHPVIATKDLEAWFFHDLEGIYRYLEVPQAQRRMDAYPNKDKCDNRKLSALFHRYSKHYQKGRRAAGFIDSLDMELIYSQVPELQTAFTAINELAKKPEIAKK